MSLLSWYFLLSRCKKAVPLQHGTNVQFDGDTQHCAAVPVDAMAMKNEGCVCATSYDAAAPNNACWQPDTSFEVFVRFVSKSETHTHNA